MSVVLHETKPYMVLPTIPDGLDVNRFLATVSPSKVTEKAGQPVIIAAHTSDTVAAARRMGLEVPSTLTTRYNWPGRFNPFDHQIPQTEFLTVHRRCLCLSSMGTGKTASAIWAADHLRREGLIRRVLIVATLSTLDSVWAQELFQILPHESYHILHGTRDQRIKAARENKSTYFITNHDSYRVGQLWDVLAKQDFDLIIYDEASALREARTARYKALTKFLRARNPRLWLLTGTPTPNAPSDAWALARLVNPYDAERNPTGCVSQFTRFRDMVMRKAGPFKWVARPNAKIVVRQALQPAIRYRKEDCIDLPEMLTTERHAEITPDQTRAYTEMKKLMITNAVDDNGVARPVSAINAAGQLNKLLQILSGAAYQEDGEVVHFDMSPKLAAMKELITESEKKTIVFVPYRHVLARVHAYLIDEGITADVIDGSVTGKARDLVLRRFTRESDPRVLIAHPKTASHGLNLTCASTIVWFGPCMSCETYIQGNERMNRPGQDSKMLIAHLYCHEVEHKYFQLLQDRENLQNGILNLYNAITETK